MATASLNRENILVEGGKDSIVIVRDLSDIPGGATLDVSAWDEDKILAGHIIKRNLSTGELSPLGVSNGQYVDLASSEVGGETVYSEEYAGVLKYSVLKSKPFAAILTIGSVNAKASPYPVNADIKAGLKTIDFLYS